jgi:hypothetical protein
MQNLLADIKIELAYRDFWRDLLIAYQHREVQLFGGGNKV